MLTSTEASQQLKARASAGLAEVRRIVDRDLTRARQLLDAAQEDLADGRQQEAEQKLAALREMDVELGWFDQQRLDRLNTVLENRRMQAEQTAEQEAAEQAAEQAAAKEAQAQAAAAQAEEQAASDAMPEAEDEGPQDQADMEPAAATGESAMAQGAGDDAAAEQSDAAEAQAESSAAEAEQPRSDLLAEAAMLYAQEKAAEADQAMEAGQYARAARLLRAGAPPRSRQ